MLKSAALQTLEKTINFILARDPESSARLKALAGNTILLNSTEPEMTIYWLFETDKILLRTQWHDSRQREHVTASISGNMNALLRLGFTKAKIAKELTVTGDLHAIEAFKELFAQLDIDWEDYFSRYTGDVVAHHMTQAVSKTWGVLKQALGSLSQSTTEYLQEEIHVAPTKAALTDFAADVRELNRDVDRLAARIKRINNAIT